MKYKWILKISDLITLEKTWKKLKCILLSESSQFEKTTYCMIPLWHSGIDKTMKSVKGPVIAKSLGVGGMNRQSTEHF